MIADLLLLINSCATWIMVGVILFVQRVHYPLFDRYHADDFATTEARHQARTFGVVFVPMLVELLSSLALLILVPRGVPVWQPWVGAGLVGVWGCSTVLVQIPLHEQLAIQFDAACHRRLVRFNWLRVAAWVGHGMICLFMLFERLQSG